MDGLVVAGALVVTGALEVVLGDTVVVTTLGVSGGVVVAGAGGDDEAGSVDLPV